MAVARAFVTVDYTFGDVFFGQVVRADSNAIIIDSGFDRAEYYGNFFVNQFSGTVSGTLTAYRGYSNGQQTVSLDNASVSAGALFNAIQINADFDQAVRLMLGGSDEIFLADGANRVSGFDGNDTINGGSGSETLEGGNGADRIRGNDGFDILIGESGNDSLEGGADADQLIGGANDDLLLGGPGTDTAYFSGARSEYNVLISSNGTIVTDRLGFDGSDLLVDVEGINFDGDVWTLDRFDSSASLSEAAFRSFTELYIAYFNRAPDAEGLLFWANAFANGFAIETIAALFFDQPETQATYPDTSDISGFIQSVYGNVLGRAIDQAGFDFWFSVLSNGSISEPEFILEIIKGAKAPSPPGASQEFLDQKAADVAYLENKTDIGLYYSAIRGLSDVQDADSVMSLFDGSQGSVQAAKVATDALFADASDAFNGEFILQLVGVVDDPFLIV